MALIPCPECGYSISNRAYACPKCGFPYDDYRRKDELIEYLNNKEYHERQKRIKNDKSINIFKD